MLAAGAVFAVTALAYAEETIVEKRTYESEKQVDVAPAPEVKERVVEERVVKERPKVEKHTDTVVTTHEHDDDEDDDD
jgi:xanthine/CO dehydrogenase XdhC/CoxF family maturation factor